MRKRVFGFAAGVSLLLGVAMVVLWLRSYGSFHDQITYKSAAASDHHHWEASVISRRGYFTCWLDRSYDDWGVPVGLQFYFGRSDDKSPTDLPEERPVPFGVKWLHSNQGVVDNGFEAPLPAYNEWEINVSYLAAFTALAVLPAIWLMTAQRRARRLRHGVCLHCGYDLRATPERCPECGEVVRGK